MLDVNYYMHMNSLCRFARFRFAALQYWLRVQILNIRPTDPMKRRPQQKMLL
jgi:hypothetical protein